ncbi:MAG: EamA family transporter [Parasporobacterium sp.]|nr:EamA family transporter [Parasporobacterium sp.]
MSLIWPIILAVVSDVIYQVSAKSMPSRINPFASLTITYLVGAAVSLIIFFIASGGQNIFLELKKVNWTTFVLGLAIVGLEAGSIYMYKAGWNLNTGYIVKSLILAIALIAVGYVLYKETLSVTKIAGIVLCLGGLVLINI